jgi:hypothetical protein
LTPALVRLLMRRRQGANGGDVRMGRRLG